MQDDWILKLHFPADVGLPAWVLETSIPAPQIEVRPRHTSKPPQRKSDGQQVQNLLKSLCMTPLFALAGSFASAEHNKLLCKSVTSQSALQVKRPANGLTLHLWNCGPLQMEICNIWASLLSRQKQVLSRAQSQARLRLRTQSLSWRSTGTCKCQAPATSASLTGVLPTPQLT